MHRELDSQPGIYRNDCLRRLQLLRKTGAVLAKLASSPEVQLTRMQLDFNVIAEYVTPHERQTHVFGSHRDSLDLGSIFLFLTSNLCKMFAIGAPRC